MSSTGFSSKHFPASLSRANKRKATEPADAAGPSRTPSVSPLPDGHAIPSPAASSSKRASTSLFSSRESRQPRTFQISDVIEDEDEDATYDEELDTDGEVDEGYLDQDAPGEDEFALASANIEPVHQSYGTVNKAPASATPARQPARPKRTNAANTSYYVEPLPSLSDEDPDEDETPSIRRRARKKQLPPTSDIEADIGEDVENPGSSSAKSSRNMQTVIPVAIQHLPGKVPRRPSGLDTAGSKRSSAQPEEPELSEEAKAQAKAEKDAEDLRSRWTEEYFEIVEQLPLEVHRTFALMRELEGQMQARVNSMVRNMMTYRDARLKLQDQFQIDTTGPPDAAEQGFADDQRREGSEDEAENLLGGSQDSPANERNVDGLDVDETKVFDKEQRRELLRLISLAANESVKAAEEKMGLAATAYNWIDRHIRRLDADISKLESSILLGLRTGTEESRGAREALGLPLDDEAAAIAQGNEDEMAVGGNGVSAEAESASLAKAAGAANRAPNGPEAVGGRRSTRTTPKMGGQAQLAASPKSSSQALTRSRSRSASVAAATSTAVITAAVEGPPTRKAASPAPATARITRKRKPKPLSPQKGGRRSIVTSTPTLISPTTQTPRAGTSIVGPDVSEMPFDPTEPRYCYCDQISFDEMIACDNEDCAMEWFHYACVGITESPDKKKTWYCRFCAPTGWKGSGMAVPANAKHKPPGFRKGIGIKP
ncbi:uncharacterized protein MEPE_03710 [Melanopsichium pennsylvanicum]|uniref:Chromatin modification-related protein n=2 Tax=Melanopsichium pennsylvanicum TaxID=63383 RepID=A0AAJ4XNF5_9BASI|nr:inhibitor of growth protein 5-like [Melanopsichium pennsylvanicum 4]SNX85001.1 uncharacterized protein MEPE_03710 [Melanopsichium pennsylvanicum]